MLHHIRLILYRDSSRRSIGKRYLLLGLSIPEGLTCIVVGWKRKRLRLLLAHRASSLMRMRMLLLLLRHGRMHR